MIEIAIAWVAAVIFIEATVEIEVQSELFEGFRARMIKIPAIGWYLHGLFSCGYCLSVWVSALTALFVPGSLISLFDDSVIYGILGSTPLVIADYLFKVFVLHRLSNIWHEVVYRWLARMPYILGLRPTEFEPDTMELEADGAEKAAGDAGDSGQEDRE
jgi:hypothetical protein